MIFVPKKAFTDLPRFFSRVLQQGPSLVSPEDLSLPLSPLAETTVEENEEVLGDFDRFAEEDTISDDKAPSSSTRVKKKTEEDDEFDNRFKLQNGREVSFFLIFMCDSAHPIYWFLVVFELQFDFFFFYKLFSWFIRLTKLLVGCLKKIVLFYINSNFCLVFVIDWSFGL